VGTIAVRDSHEIGLASGQGTQLVPRGSPRHDETKQNEDRCPSTK